VASSKLALPFSDLPKYGGGGLQHDFCTKDIEIISDNSCFSL
jgi:hypothetical protein